MSVFGFTTDTF